MNWLTGMAKRVGKIFTWNSLINNWIHDLLFEIPFTAPDKSTENYCDPARVPYPDPAQVDGNGAPRTRREYGRIRGIENERNYHAETSKFSYIHMLTFSRGIISQENACL
jgi:hypothetical protein